MTPKQNKSESVAWVLSTAGGGRGRNSSALGQPRLPPTPIGEGIGATFFKKNRGKK